MTQNSITLILQNKHNDMCAEKGKENSFSSNLSILFIEFIEDSPEENMLIISVIINNFRSIQKKRHYDTSDFFSFATDIEKKIYYYLLNVNILWK
mgnify:CR=1 FL=1